MQPISRDDLLALLDTGPVALVEALPEAHYAAEHLPGAVNLPGELTADLAARLVADRDRTVVTYCSGPSCSRSKTAAAARWRKWDASSTSPASASARSRRRRYASFATRRARRSCGTTWSSLACGW